jgi:hypothetical protein
VPALVLSFFAATILWGRFGTLKALLGQLPAPAVPPAESGNAPRIGWDGKRLHPRGPCLRPDPGTLSPSTIGTFSIEQTQSDSREQARAC